MRTDEPQQSWLSLAGGHVGNTTLTRGIASGVIGSLVGTIVMDLVMIGEFAMMRQPAYTFLALIGSVFGGGVALGVVAHIVMGSLLGVVFSVAVLTVDALRISTLGRGVVLGVLAGVVTIPGGCVPFAIVTGVPVATMVSFSAVPHVVWGVVLGLFAGYGLRSEK